MLFFLTDPRKDDKIHLYQMRHFGGFMTEAVLSILESCTLFRDCTPDKIRLLLQKCGAASQHFSAGDEILLSEKELQRFGIVISGSLTVYAPGEERTPLNHLKTGNLFGVSVLFGSPGAGTRIFAASEGEVLFITEDRSEVLWEDQLIRRNLISFLTDRICFLNRKIASFTAKGAEGKVARLLSQRADAEGICRIDSSFSDLAKELHLGRASLYRALDKLEAEGFICREKKEIRLLNPESL